MLKEKILNNSLTHEIKTFLLGSLELSLKDKDTLGAKTTPASQSL